MLKCSDETILLIDKLKHINGVMVEMHGKHRREVLLFLLV